MIQALGKYLVIEVAAPKSVGGIALPDSKDGGNRGRVVSVGVDVTGAAIDCEVIFNKEKAVRIDENHYAVELEQVVATIKE